MEKQRVKNKFAGSKKLQIEFKSGGKAYMSMGPITNTCTYTESGKNVTLNCGPGKTLAFTVDDDGALNGPPGGMVSKADEEEIVVMLRCLSKL